MEVRILGLSGSLRAGSFNTLLVREAMRLIDPAEAVLADLRLPLYDGDLEARGLPDAVRALMAAVRAADAVVIATPEYNKNLSGVLKNALDWISRDKPQPLARKPVAILSAAAGVSGGARAQYSLRHCLTPFDCRLVQVPEVMVGNAEAAFDAAGRLTDPAAAAALARLMEALQAVIGMG